MFEKTINLIGQSKVEALQNSKVLVFGVGGVGSYAVEMFARCGVGEICIVDCDVVSKSNINRQIIALNSTIGQTKVQVMQNRILDINPNAKVTAICQFVTKDNLNDFNLKHYDYVVDCVDNITAKIALAKKSEEENFNLISCMGTGNKLCPELFEIADIYATSVCPLAKVMRAELKKQGVSKLKVLYSKEKPTNLNKQRVPASICFTPSIAGIRIAEFVIKELIKELN